ncbi:MAG TPA: methylmalonyl-CoA mutase family protein [Candidatus Obscuribacterales bacterium]
MSILPETPDLDQAFALPELSLWHEAAAAALKGADFERALYTRTLEGITLKPLYTAKDTAADLADLAHLAGDDGRRGLRTSPGWEMAQEIPEQLPERFAAALSQDLSQGLDGLSLDLDELAPESARALGTALEPLAPGQTGLHLRCREPLAGVIALESWLQAHSGSWSQLRGSYCSDPLARLLKDGHGDPQADFDSLAQALAFLQGQSCPLRAVVIDAVPWHEAGAHAAQELAFATAAMVETIQQLGQRGIAPEAALGSAGLRLGVGVGFCMELAKFRAARVLLRRVALAYGCEQLPQVQAVTSRLWLTRADPYNNFLRQTLGALAAVLGGAEVLTTGCFNESSGPPDAFARRLARNLQLILREEVKLGQLLDPVGGSFFLESLTSELAEAAWKAFQQLEAGGGLLAALLVGGPQQAVAATARERLQRVHTRRQVLVGSNQYVNPGESLAPVHTGEAFAPSAELAPLELPAEPDARLQAGIAAFGGGASWPSLSRALAGSERLRPEALTPIRLAAGFEALRAEAAAAPRRVLLLPLGPEPGARARLDFSRGLFEVAGMQVTAATACTRAEDALEQVASEQPDILVLCSSDAAYSDWVPALAPQLKAEHPQLLLVLAGRPGAQEQAWREAGIGSFVYLGCDALEVLSSLQGQA